MSTVNYIRYVGWDIAKELLKNSQQEVGRIAELKKYCEDYDLVKRYGGLENANNLIINSYIDSNHEIPKGHEELSIAVNLVEEVENVK